MTLQNNGRTIAALVAAKANDVEVELVETEANANAEFNKSAEYLKLSPLGKVPAFEGANGYTLSESIAIAVYGMYFDFFFLVKDLPRLYYLVCPPLDMMSEFYSNKIVIPGRTTVLMNQTLKFL